MSELTQNSVKANVKYVSLQEITTKIGSGATPIGGKESYKDHGISLIRSLNVYDFSFKYQDLAFIDENQARKLSNVEVEPKDILLNITGASVGRCTIVPKKILPARVNQHVSIIRLNPEIADSLYVLYTINSRHFKSSLLNLSQTGATREALTKEDICGFKIPIPPLPTQRKIAAVLSAYDDLIENNDRRIALLEKMAEEIYREWFVRLRFPGHEQVKSHKGIPEGWKMIQLGSVMADIIDYRGITPKKLNSDWQDDGVIALSALNVKTGKLIRLEDSKRVSEALFEKWMRKKLERLDILLTSEAPLGEVYILMEKAKYVLSQRLFAIRANPKKIEPLYLYYYLLCEVGQYELTSKATGSTVGGIRQTLLRKVEILNPTAPMQRKFSSIVEPTLEEIQKLWSKNNLLRQTRDRLLTRLISGKLSVEDLDIQLPSSMTADS
jgi:type I restriction enzyme S subunit